MYQIKNRIYQTLNKTQKTGICNYIRALVKQNLDKDVILLFEMFIDNESYYLKQNASRFPFLANLIDNKQFVDDTIEYIKECKKFYEYKEKQRPIIEAQKEFDKKKKKFLQEIKMSKDKPTKKQLYYYDRLCKKYSIDKMNIEGLSKLDLKNEIERIINEHSGDYKNIN